MIDFGCQVNLAKVEAIPSFFWEKAPEHLVAIEGTPIKLLGRVLDFPVKIEGLHEVLSLNRFDNIKEDCILGSEFLNRVSPVTYDNIRCCSNVP